MAHFRRLDWNPAISAAALEHRTPYALRHTYATFAIAAGVPTFHVARFMGTSLEQIDRTTGTCCRPRSTRRGRRSTRSSPQRRRRPQRVWARSGHRSPHGSAEQAD
jgi:hypothetical protein